MATFFNPLNLLIGTLLVAGALALLVGLARRLVNWLTGRRH
jgi:hypothetical protein